MEGGAGRNMGMEQNIRERLTEAFEPTHLEVVNESAQHAGHAGDDGSGESHWRVEIASAHLIGMTRVAQHRAIHAALKDEMPRIHALAISVVS